MSSMPTIRVFQDLSVIAVDKDAPALRDKLIATARKPWFHDPEAESRIVGAKLLPGEGMVAFRRERDLDAEAALVTLWPNGAGGYKVTNIVPREANSLSEQQYNVILRDFAETVVKAAAPDSSIELSPDHEGPLDWTSQSAANALWEFCASANKATGASHPSDRQSWMHFLVMQHETGHGRLTPSRLAQWLVKADKWPEDVANDLAIEYESAIELLDYYDGHK
ncbi:hypothetical protein B0G81_6471 [Paraburkholderia sp. BL6665CI2N2]|uniref:hypothetical protein n=1 Tax=Paraburkholderia sp. BL6665CI2N2 TaxID=1938806 RepID=UPI0010663726|nr:hypothetical protein [Paraburkholderia sp. BL6665CI2N2]TDY25974.1 hypothetical protein B0G81_6471 [Paraburkholderia sp. BL6665CI2N2]